MIKKSLLAVVFASALVQSSFAGSSGWMNANEFERFSKSELNKKGRIPTSIKCKAENVTKGLSRKNTFVKVTFTDNPNRTRWRWAWGTSVAPSHNRFVKQGYKRVSYDQTRRKSGLKLSCALWHRSR